MGDTDTGRVTHVRMVKKDLVHFQQREFFPSAQDHVVGAAANEIPAVGVPVTVVAGVEVALVVECTGRAFRVVIITRRDNIAAQADFTFNVTAFEGFAGIRILQDDLTEFLVGPPGRPARKLILIPVIERRRECANRHCLRHAVHGPDNGSFGPHGSLNFRRNDLSRHVRSQAFNVESFPIRVAHEIAHHGGNDIISEVGLVGLDDIDHPIDVPSLAPEQGSANHGKANCIGNPAAVKHSH